MFLSLGKWRLPHFMQATESENDVVMAERARVQTPVKLTFEEYLAHDDGDNRYEFVNGELILMAPPTGRHADIIDFLIDTFKAQINGASSYAGVLLQDGEDVKYAITRLKYIPS